MSNTKTLIRKTLLFAAALLLCSTAAMAQASKRVTISMKNASVKEVFAEITRQASVGFIYGSSVNQLPRKDYYMQNAEVRKVVNYALEGSDYVFEQEGNNIVIKIRRQEQAVSGRIISDLGDPLIGVHIQERGNSKNVCVTDMDGKFSMPSNGRTQMPLTISYIGMKTQVLTWKGRDLHIVMEPESKHLDEVVITGYQTIDKRKLTSAVTSVRAEEIMRPDVSSIDKMLEGQIPDLILTSNSGEVGTVPRLRIRGTSTLIGNREPLWVLDGVVLQDPVDVSPEELNNPDYVNRIGNAIAGINPQDIERIDVLKDASATALYGAKAANGVIVITTKRGHLGKPTVRYNGTVTLRQRPRYSDNKIDLMNSQERINFSRDLFNSGYRYGQNTNMIGYEGVLKQYYEGKIDYATLVSQTQMLEQTNTDWFDILTRDAVSSQHTASLSGGNEKMRYYASLGLTDDNDVIRQNDNRRYSIAAKLDATINRIFSAQLNVMGNVSKREYAMDEITPLNYAYNTSRAIPAYNADGSLCYYQRGATVTTTYDYNILNELNNSSNKQRGTNINVNLTLNARFTDYLKASVIGSYQTSSTTQEQWWGERTYHVAELRQSNYGVAPPVGTANGAASQLPFGGELTTNSVRNDALMMRTQVDFNKFLDKQDAHNIAASVGMELNSTKYDATQLVARGYYKDRGRQFSNISLTDYPAYTTWLENNHPVITDNLTNLLSAYATVSYSYKNYVTLNANARMDGSNKFGDRSNEKLLPIWSVSANYNISEHPFLKRDWIDYIMLKASYGYQGNMLSGQSPQMIIHQKPMDPLYGELVSSLDVYPNPNLRWEKTTSFNLGLEFSLFDRRLQFEGSYYRKSTKDAFLNKDISSVNGVQTYVVNSGDITNYGYSLAVTAVPVRLKDFSWTLATSFSKVFNKLNTQPGQEQYELGNFLNGTALINGKPVGTFFSYKFLGLSPADGSPLFDTQEENQEELVNLTKYQFYTTLLEESGSREPTVSGAINNTFRYKNWRLNMMLNYSLGAKIRKMRLYGNSFDPVNNVSRDFVNHWCKPGDELTTDIPAPGNASFPWSTGAGNLPAVGTTTWEMYNYSNHRVVSADYLKMGNLALTYKVPMAFISKYKLSRLAISLTGNNLFTICSSELRGQTPQQSGFAEVQLTDRPSYSFGIDIAF